MEKFHRVALEVARAVARIIALALDLKVEFFDQPEMLGEPIAILRLLHYEAGAHFDYGLITLLATDGVSGLQICKDRDAKPQIWEDVPPLKGSNSLHADACYFIVNLGDMLERWSNCIFKSTLHRVLVNGQERYS
ncbi:putative 2-oxoglutarate-dependent dioxygenase, partial [Quercus suber]